MIELIRVSKRYPSGHEALQDINLKMADGSMAFITGHSGAGKSSLLKILALIERCSSGRVIVDKTELTRLSLAKIPWYRRQIGVVFQQPVLLADKSIFDNVALPLIVSGFRRQDIKKRVRSVLNMVGLLDKAGSRPQMLSCGEQQRIGLARAVVHKPKLLLADEPTGNLDPHLAAEMMNLLAQFNQVGVTVLVASHDTLLIDQFHYPKIVLRHGRLLHEQQ